MKSHLAADGVPFFAQAKYIVVGRDTRDVFMSLWNHYSSYTDLIYQLLNDAQRPGPEFPRARPRPESCGRAGSARAGSIGNPTGGRTGHTIIIWPHGGRRVTCRTSCSFTTATCSPISTPRCDALRRSSTSKSTRRRGRRSSESSKSKVCARTRERDGDPASMTFERGAASFFYKGTNGRWRDTLTDDDLALYENAASTLDPNLRSWLEGGGHAVEQSWISEPSPSRAGPWFPRRRSYTCQCSRRRSTPSRPCRRRTCRSHRPHGLPGGRSAVARGSEELVAGAVHKSSADGLACGHEDVDQRSRAVGAGAAAVPEMVAFPCLSTVPRGSIVNAIVGAGTACANWTTRLPLVAVVVPSPKSSM